MYYSHRNWPGRRLAPRISLDEVDFVALESESEIIFIVFFGGGPRAHANGRVQRGGFLISWC